MPKTNTRKKKLKKVVKKKIVTTPKPMGRPSKFKMDMCKQVIEFMKTGMSKFEIGLELNLSQDTINRWGKNNKNFSEAIKKGVDFSQGWWEREARLNIGNKNFNAVLWYMNMRNRFGWSDNAGLEGDKDISITLNYDPKKIKKK